MAKISANGATEVGRWETTAPVRKQFLLRSDGQVLKRSHICGKWEGWTLVRWPKTTMTIGDLRALLVRKGYTLKGGEAAPEGQAAPLPTFRDQVLEVLLGEWTTPEEMADRIAALKGGK